MPTIPDKPAVAKQVVRAKITIGVSEYHCLSFDPMTPDSVDTVEVRTVGGEKTVYLPGAVTNTGTVEVKVLQGEAEKPAIGALVDLKIETDVSENGAAAESAPAVTVPCFVQQIVGDKIEGSGGSRQLVWTITLQPTNISPAA